MKYHILHRALAVLNHFRQVKGKGNTWPLLDLLDKHPDLQMLVTTKSLFDNKYSGQLVSVTDVARKAAPLKPTIVDHYVLTELLGGSAKLIEVLTSEILRVTAGELSADPNHHAYSPIAHLMKVKVDDRYVANCTYVNIPFKTVHALKTNGKGQPVLVEGGVQTHAISGKSVHVYFTLP